LANIKSIDQSTLLEHCLLNKEWAQKELYDLYSSELFPICCRYATDKEEAKDILQEGFIRIFTCLKQYKGNGSLAGWMKRVVVTTALNYIKKNRKAIFSDIDLYQDYLPHTNAEVDATINAKEIMEAFMQVPYNYRTILGLHIIDGYSYKELSTLLQIEESTCRTKVHRGKQFLQNILHTLNKSLVINK
jgi:RNA polymerase sigma factor (sigma-70 family)